MTSMDDDGALLRLYVREKSQEAFTALVQRHIDMVYASALRQAAGDSFRARDVTQLVFTALSKKAPLLTSHPSVAGWLHQAARLAARQEIRRAAAAVRREQAFAAMMIENEPLGPQVIPRLDDWLARLSARDREVLLLRFFEGHSYARISQLLQLTEDAARMRVERALVRLRDVARKRGVASSAAALSALLAEQGAIAAPPDLPTLIESTASTWHAGPSRPPFLRVGVGTVPTALVTIGVTGIVTAAALLTWGRIHRDLYVPIIGPVGTMHQTLTTVSGAPPPRKELSGGAATEGPPRSHVKITVVPFSFPMPAGTPHALSVSGATYATEIATTMYWGHDSLHLTPDQKDIVQGTYQQMRERQAALEQGLIQVEDEGPATVTVNIPAYDGERLLQEFAASLDKWIGPGTGDRFFSAYHVALVRDSFGFGEYPQRYKLRRKDAALVEIVHSFKFNPMQKFRVGATDVSIDTPVSVSSTDLVSITGLGPDEFLRNYIPPEP